MRVEGVWEVGVGQKASGVGLGREERKRGCELRGSRLKA